MIRHPLLLSLLALLCAGSHPLPAQDSKPQAPDPQQQPLGHHAIEVPIQNGRVSLLTLSRRLLDAYGLDGQQLRFKDLAVRVTGMRGAWGNTKRRLRVTLSPSSATMGSKS